MMIRNLFFLLIVIFTIASCSNQDGKIIYEFTDDITAEWNKEYGILKFSGNTEGLYLIDLFRAGNDTIPASNSLTIDINLPGPHTYQLYDGSKTIGNQIKINRKIHKGLDAICTYNKPSKPFNKTNILNDGIGGSEDNLKAQWVGWKNKDAVIEYDFGGDQSLTYVSVTYRDDIENNIYPPQYVSVEGSLDGVTFRPRQKKIMDPPGYPITQDQIPIRGTYQKIRITVKNYSTSGNIDSWLMLDEIVLSEY